jgi:RimJ/RimL family protein N-acetyltransferase
MSLSADDVVLECNIEILGRERPLLNKAWLEMQNMYASLADARYPDVNAFIESCELFGVIVVTDGYFERKGALDKWDEEQGQMKVEMASSEEQMLQPGLWPIPQPTAPNRLQSTIDDLTPIPPVQQAGVAYLKSVEPGEATVGVYITEAWQAETFDVQIIKLLLRWAFEEVGFHRIQTTLLQGSRKVSLMKLFSHVGFSHEGTRRKSQVGPDAVYKDVTLMGMVDMDWRVWAVYSETPRTLWDRLFDRQQREREEILTDDGDDEDRFVGKKASTGTLRANVDEYVRSAKSTTTGSIIGGFRSNTLTTSGAGPSDSEWDKVEGPSNSHESDSISLESDFENLLKQDSIGEPGPSHRGPPSSQDSDYASLVDRDGDWEDYEERVAYP